MKNLIISIYNSFKRHPFSLVAYMFTLIPWGMVYLIRIRMHLNPPVSGYDFRGEGAVFGVLLAMVLSAALLIVMVLNLYFQKNKSFYVNIIALIIISNLFLYGVGMI